VLVYGPTFAINDIDDDGDLDIIAGNIGQNNFYKKGTTIFINDFDNNGTTEQIICQKTKWKLLSYRGSRRVNFTNSFLKKEIIIL